MRRIHSFHLFVFLILMVACDSGYDKLIEDFQTIDAKVVAGDYKSLLNDLDSTSLQLVVELSKSEDRDTDQMLKIGEEYRCELVVMQYFQVMGMYLETNSNQTAIFKFLSTASGAPWFNYYEDFQLAEEQIRLGKDTFLPVYKQSAGNNVLSWLKFDYDNSGALKFDLVYFLQREEQKLWQRVGTRISQASSSRNKSQQIKDFLADGMAFDMEDFQEQESYDKRSR